MIGSRSARIASMPIVATLSLMAASACSRSCTFTMRIGSEESEKSSLRYAVCRSSMIHCTYACTRIPCRSAQIQRALMTMVCTAAGMSRNASVNGLNRNEMPRPTVNGSRCPRRVCTTYTLGGTTTVFHQRNPVIR